MRAQRSRNNPFQQTFLATAVAGQGLAIAGGDYHVSEWNAAHLAFTVHDVQIEPPIDLLNKNITILTEAVDNLTNRLDRLEIKLEQLLSSSSVERDISDTQAKIEIKALFESMHGETIFPSEIADELRLGYDQVVRLLTELENEGSIKSTDSSAPGSRD